MVVLRMVAVFDRPLLFFRQSSAGTRHRTDLCESWLSSIVQEPWAYPQFASGARSNTIKAVGQHTTIFYKVSCYRPRKSRSIDAETCTKKKRCETCAFAIVVSDITYPEQASGVGGFLILKPRLCPSTLAVQVHRAVIWCTMWR